MSLSCLLAECEAADIRLFADSDGGLIIDAPPGALTPVLLDRLKAAKLELLTVLADGEECEAMDQVDRPCQAPWTADECEPLGPDGWPVGSVDPDDVPVCPHCGLQEAWQSIASDPFGLTPGTWRCLRCDPPAAATRLRQRTAELRKGASDCLEGRTAR